MTIDGCGGSSSRGECNGKGDEKNFLKLLGFRYHVRYSKFEGKCFKYYKNILFPYLFTIIGN